VIATLGRPRPTGILASLFAAWGCLAVENARLHADLAAQLAEVRASRARIIEAGDAERRRVERDLHDGAQQRMVSVALTLRLALDQVGIAPDDALRRSLIGAVDQLNQALAELRELVNGIHPAVLTEGGLGPALRSIAELAPVPVALASVPEERFPQPVEAAVYFVVREALTNVAKHANAGAANVGVRRQDGRVVVEVADDGVGGADSLGSGLRGLADRVAALEGRLEVISLPGSGTRVVATIPCM
jgi:signal transduction histidine kinase